MSNNKKMPHVAVVFEAKNFEFISSMIQGAMMNLIALTENLENVQFEHEMIADCLMYMYENVHNNEMGYIDLDVILKAE